MERLSWELIHEMKDRNIVIVSVISFRGPRLFAPIFLLASVPWVIVRALQTDIVHLGDPLLSFHGWIVKKLFKKTRVVVAVHGLDLTYPNAAYQLYLKLFFRNFDHYLPISQHVANLTKAHGARGSVHVLHPAIHDRYFDPSVSHQELMKLVGFSVRNDQYILFTCARLVKRKGHEWFIRNVLSYVPTNVVYIIAGDGPERDSIERAIRDTGLGSRVLLLGRTPDRMLRTLYNTIDLFVQPNIHIPHDVEGFGLAMLEAALCQRIVLASKLEGIPDAIHNGKNGMLIAPQLAQIWIKTIATLSRTSHSTNQNARMYTLQQFSWTRYIQQFLTIIQAF